MNPFARFFLGTTLAVLYFAVLVACDVVFIWLGDHVTPMLQLSNRVQDIIFDVYLFLPLVLVFLTGALAQRLGVIEGSHAATLTAWFLGFLLCGVNDFLLIFVWLAAEPRMIQ